MNNKYLDLSRFDLDKLHNQFINEQPFPHIVFDNFFQENIVDQVYEEFQQQNFDLWDQRNHHDVQVKWRSNWLSDSDVPPSTYQLIQYMNSGDFLRFLSKLTGVHGIIPDPYLTGGGFNQINPGGLLAVHADGNWHDLMSVHRRLNVILYLNHDWQDSWNGNFELWDRDDNNQPHHCVKTIRPDWNRLIVFKTDDFSFHGHPHPLTCPPDRSRRSLILYYYTSHRPTEEVVDINNHHRALFTKLSDIQK